MKILVTGNMGYLGSILIKVLRENIENAFIIGYDAGYYAHCLTVKNILPELNVDLQRIGDIRRIPDDLLDEIDAVVCLSALSNDPIGNKFEELTLDINYRSSAILAHRAAKHGVKSFVFASSCSIYGFAQGNSKTEEDPLNPLTAYARSKVMTEMDLKNLDAQGMAITSLRFATACGMSSRLRLDLVLNDFVAGALASKKIDVLSDGTPWRPLINVKDMARAIVWALGRDSVGENNYLAVNVGDDSANYQVKDLAEAVAEVITGTHVNINCESPSDNRSYRVDFSLFKRLAPLHQPKVSLMESIEELVIGLESINFRDENFRSSDFMRLRVLEKHVNERRVDSNLFWLL